MPDLVDALMILSRVLNGFRVLVNPIFSPLTPFEAKLLTEVQPAISKAHLRTFEEHLSKVNFVQRDGGDRRIRLYQWALPARYNWNRSTYFEPRHGPVKILKFSVQFSSEPPVFGSLVSIDGVFCNITFGQDVHRLRKRTDFEVEVTGGSAANRQNKPSREVDAT